LNVFHKEDKVFLNIHRLIDHFLQSDQVPNRRFIINIECYNRRLAFFNSLLELPVKQLRQGAVQELLARRPQLGQLLRGQVGQSGLGRLGFVPERSDCF